MLLKNNTGKIIGIGMESILPGETRECPKGYENNPVVRQYLDHGTFEEICTAEKIRTAEVKPTAPPEGTGNENPEGKELEEKKLEDFSEEELTKYAVEHGIDLGRTTTKEGILKKIQEAQQK